EAIQSEVGIWRDILDINQKFTLKNIGELSLNSERNVVFTPFEQNNYLNEAFGLSSFVSPTIQREGKPVIEIPAPQAKTETPTISIPVETTNRYGWLRYTAVTVLALAAAGSIGFKLYQDRVEQQNMLVQQAVQEQVQEKIRQATFVIDSPVPAVTFALKADAPKSYHVVAGAFRVEENAQKAFDELVRLGYEPRMLPPNRFGLHPVLYGSYTTYGEASKALSGIKQSHNPDAWLLVKEL